jgi:hypothetical protein
MSETGMGLIIGGSALSIAMLMVIGHYRRERMRARMLRHLIIMSGGIKRAGECDRSARADN